ncbi:hypothetical protein LEP1GSC041_4584 [Leptospira noguchii str. 2006001870]|nr:hypothetical protein LEP1GSC041_4584 [Leptospira noguchii str. 2006001870]
MGDEQIQETKENASGIQKTSRFSSGGLRNFSLSEKHTFCK